MNYPRVPTDEDVERVYQEVWRDLVANDSGPDMEQIKKELYDYKVLMDNVSELYVTITGGQLSKSTYIPDVIRAFHEDALTEAQGLCRICGEELEDA